MVEKSKTVILIGFFLKNKYFKNIYLYIINVLQYNIYIL